MMDAAFASPDITLTVDRRGVITAAEGAGPLREESLGPMRGQAFAETVTGLGAERLAEIVGAVGRRRATTFFKVTQRLPSGRECSIDYTAVGLTGGGFVAVGRNAQAVADLQLQLEDARHARERDYWRLRELETRHRALLDATSEAVALVRASTLRVVEANPAAARALGLVPGDAFAARVPPRNREQLLKMLETARLNGRAPSIVLAFGPRSHWSLRASRVDGDADPLFLFQLTPLAMSASTGSPEPAPPVERVLRRLPEAFVVAEADGTVRWANNAFLDLVQLGDESAVVGKRLKRWLSRAGADWDVVGGIVRKLGAVRAMPTTLEGELGGEASVEVSAIAETVDGRACYGVLIREVARRAATVEAAREGGLAFTDVVRGRVAEYERVRIAEALTSAGQNRTEAARALGLSRQTLHAKIRKYGLGTA